MNEVPVVEDEDGGCWLLPYSPIDFPDPTMEIPPRDGLDYMIWAMLVHTPPACNSVITQING